MSMLLTRIVAVSLTLALFAGCATLERDKHATRQVAGEISLYLDTVLIQRADRGDNRVDEAANSALAQALAQRVRQRLKERGYQLKSEVLTIGAAPNADLPASAMPRLLSARDKAQRDSAQRLHQAAASGAQRLDPALLQQAVGSGVMLLLIHGSQKSPLELAHENILETFREMLGHSVDEIAEHTVEGRYRLALYHRTSGELLWNNWGEDQLHGSDELAGLIEPAVGSLP